MEALRVIATSWPIAVMVVGVTIALVVRGLFVRNMKYDHAEKMDRAKGNQALVVRDTRNHDNDEA